MEGKSATPCVVAAAVAGLENLLLEMEQIQGQGMKEQGKKEGLEEEVDRLTDSLVTAMSRGEEWEEKKKNENCAACNTVLEETVLQVDGQLYHPACLKCQSCSVALTGQFWTVAGKRYCSLHRDAALEVCSACSKTLDTGSVLVAGRKMHPHCFTCHQCQAPIQGKFFTTEEGKYLCEVDYKGSQEKCSSCSLPLLGPVLSALGKRLHPACFRCSSCNSGLEDKFLEHGGEAYCDGCYAREKAAQCSRCRTGIVATSPADAMVTCGDKQYYHQRCYTCKECGAPLAEVPVYRQQEEVVCGSCREKFLEEKSSEQTEREKEMAMKNI